MVVLARRAAQLCTKRYAQPHDPRALRARRLLSTDTQKQDPRTLSAAWSFLQRANPFTVWGETVGREPSDRLPKVTDLVKAVVGLSGFTERGQSVDMEMILLPLHIPGEGCNRVLGACVALEQPYWAGMHPILSQTVKSVRLIWPDERPAFLSSSMVRRTSTVPSIRHEAGFVPASVAGSGRQVQHLMVIDGGKS